MLKQSSVELFLERITTWWDHLLVPKWSMAAAAVAACAFSVWMFTPRADQSGAALTAVPVIPEKSFVPKLDLTDIPLARMAEHDDASLADMLVRKHLEVRPALEGKLPAGSAPSPLPASGWQTPTQQQAVPAVHDQPATDVAK